MQTTTLAQKTRQQLLTLIDTVSRELAAAPEWKAGTTWYTDRVREVEHLRRRLELLDGRK